MESIRSNIPPCPGSIFPVSLILDERFSIDWNRSPVVAKKAVIIPKTPHSNGDKPNPKKDRSSPVKVVKKIAPINPSQVFFGDNFRNVIGL